MLEVWNPFDKEWRRVICINDYWVSFEHPDYQGDIHILYAKLRFKNEDGSYYSINTINN